MGIIEDFLLMRALAAANTWIIVKMNFFIIKNLSTMFTAKMPWTSVNTGQTIAKSLSVEQVELWVTEVESSPEVMFCSNMPAVIHTNLLLHFTHICISAPRGPVPTTPLISHD